MKNDLKDGIGEVNIMKNDLKRILRDGIGNEEEYKKILELYYNTNKLYDFIIRILQFYEDMKYDNIDKEGI